MLQPTSAPPVRLPPSSWNLPRGCGWIFLVVLAVFAPALWNLLVFAAGDGRYSHILLLPFVSGYLIWRRRDLLRGDGVPSRTSAGALIAAGAILLLGHTVSRLVGVVWREEDSLALTTTAFVVTLIGTAFWYFSEPARRALMFPLGFLFFMVPMPHGLMSAIESFMQHGSAVVAHALFQFFGTAVYYEGLNFQLPGINLHVAPECSGIRSTLVLFIVSVIAGRFLLRSAVARIGLSALVLPLALMRNGFRIFIIGELCSHLGPQMIDSSVHRQGGPIFFGLSLVPFFFVLVVLMRRERVAGARSTLAAPESGHAAARLEPCPGPSGATAP